MNTHPTHQASSTQRTVTVELLALDLGECARCTGTLASIESALAIAGPVLDATNTRVVFESRVISSVAQARRARFVTSPTIRVNGADIAPEVVETECGDCSTLCGCEDGTLCREWQFDGERFDEAPIGLVLRALMRAAVAEPQSVSPSHGQVSEHQSDVPENLLNFFAGVAAAASKEAAKSEGGGCCGPREQASCCEPSEKASCCDPDPSVTSCGCK